MDDTAIDVARDPGYVASDECVKRILSEAAKHGGGSGLLAAGEVLLEFRGSDEEGYTATPYQDLLCDAGRLLAFSPPATCCHETGDNGNGGGHDMIGLTYDVEGPDMPGDSNEPLNLLRDSVERVKATLTDVRDCVVKMANQLENFESQLMGGDGVEPLVIRVTRIEERLAEATRKADKAASRQWQVWLALIGAGAAIALEVLSRVVTIKP